MEKTFGLFLGGMEIGRYATEQEAREDAQFALQETGVVHTVAELVNNTECVVECTECAGTGFGSSGTGYNAVCDECGGQGKQLWGNVEIGKGTKTGNETR